MRRHTQTQDFLKGLLQMPAFQAGLFVMAAVLASMCNFGLFALLLVARMTLDAVLWRASTKMTREQAVVGTLRANLLDLMLLVVGLNLVVFAAAAPSFIAHSAVDLALWTILLGLALLISKLTIFIGFVRSLTSPHLSKTKRGILTVAEMIFVFVIVAGLLLLTASPRIVEGGARTVLTILRRQIIPWRL